MDELKNNPELIHGDFFRKWKQVERGSVALILCDPPYNILGSIPGCIWDKALDWNLLETIFSKILKPSGLVVIFCDINLMVELMTKWTNKLNYKHYHCWKKPGGMPVNLTRPIGDSEFILVFKQAGMRVSDLTFNPDGMGETGTVYSKRNYSSEIPTRRMKKSKVNQNLNGNRFPKTIIEAPGKPNMEAHERTDHPTQKPIVLMRKLIRGYSNPGELILDPFSGSGSTLVSAFKEGRKSIGYELQKNYYDEAFLRIENLVAQEVLF